MKNPYEVLGVSPSATDDDIRKAYRKLAKKYHPDLNQGDKAAEARFREVNAANDILGDPAKRLRFDRGEIDANGQEKFGFGGGASGFSGFKGGRSAGGAAHGGFSFDGDDFFEQIFGEQVRNARASQAGAGFGGRGAGRGPAKGMDINHKITVDFVDACLGAKRRMVIGGKELDVTIPEGIEEGQTLRLRGQGGGGGAFGAPRGDMLLEVQIAQHAYFRRQGHDIHLDLPITLVEAIDGGKVMVPTLTGKVYLTVPPGSNSGKVLRLKGKGIKGGDQYVILRVILPDPVDEDLKAAIRKADAKSPYDPRDGM